ncbi:MAG: glycosyltransferase family 4 protein [bacterium]|nr:glycosyltransferase family 4 protein [bacterium]
MKTCEALARLGADVELVVPKRHNAIATDPFVYYSIEPIFTITYLPTIEFVWKGISYAFALQTFAFTLSLARYLSRKNTDGAYLYVRGEIGWMLPLISKAAFVWENHIRARKSVSEARAVRRAKGVIVVTKQYCEDLIRDYGLQSDTVLVAPDAVDLEQFALSLDKSEARQKLNLPLDKKLILYVGSDLPWKGLRILREASLLLPKEYEVVYVGPIESKGSSRRESFVGSRSHKEIPLWLSAADALVLTGDASSDISRHYTSPMKLFEYMAARRPIIATDLPSFRDVISEESAVLVRPDDPQALADGIMQAVSDPVRDARVAAAWQAVQEYSWKKRAERILEFIRDCSVL